MTESKRIEFCVLSRSCMEAIQWARKPYQLELFWALYHYAFDGVEPDKKNWGIKEETAWEMCFRSLSKSRKSALNKMKKKRQKIDERPIETSQGFSENFEETLQKNDCNTLKNNDELLKYKILKDKNMKYEREIDENLVDTPSLFGTLKKEIEDGGSLCQGLEQYGVSGREKQLEYLNDFQFYLHTQDPERKKTLSDYRSHFVRWLLKQIEKPTTQTVSDRLHPKPLTGGYYTDIE